MSSNNRTNLKQKPAPRTGRRPRATKAAALAAWHSLTTAEQVEITQNVRGAFLLGWMKALT